MPSTNLITDGVMLKSEKSVQHLHAQPPVLVESRLRRTVASTRKEHFLLTDSVEDKLALMVVVPQSGCDDLARAINLGAIPPSRVQVAVAGACVV